MVIDSCVSIAIMVVIFFKNINAWLGIITDIPILLSFDYPLGQKGGLRGVKFEEILSEGEGLFSSHI